MAIRRATYSCCARSVGYNTASCNKYTDTGTCCNIVMRYRSWRASLIQYNEAEYQYMDGNMEIWSYTNISTWPSDKMPCTLGMDEPTIPILSIDLHVCGFTGRLPLPSSQLPHG